MGRVADVVDFESEMACQFTLDPDVPLPHIGNVEVWINRCRKCEGILWEVRAGSRLCCRNGYLGDLVVAGRPLYQDPRVYKVAFSHKAAKMVGSREYRR